MRVSAACYGPERVPDASLGPRRPQRLPDAPKRAEVDAIVDSLNGDGALGLRNRALVELVYSAGLRSAEARQEATRLVAAAQAQIAQEVRRARTELRAEVGTLAIQIAERLVRKSLNDEDHQRLVREALTRTELTVALNETLAARAELESKGVVFDGDTIVTGVCKQAWFKDPDGNALMLHRRFDV